MHAETLDDLYGAIGNALGRIGESGAPLFLATLVLDLIARLPEGVGAHEAIDRAERLTRESSRVSP